MARVKLAEYSAKKLLLPTDYQGVSLRLDSLDQDIKALDSGTEYVVKVDQGIKKRGKQGLIKLNIPAKQVKPAVKDLSQHGYSRFIAEPMLTHSDNQEHYLSFERTRDGIAISYSPHGGIDVEDHVDEIKSFIYPDDIDGLPLRRDFIDRIVTTMNQQHFSFLEINPLVIKDDEYYLLDAAVLADSAASHLADWGDDDIVEATDKHPAELAVADLQASSPASFSLRVLEPNGALWLLLSGGGASITLADEAADHGKIEAVGNYGEYSGGPTTQETYLYAQQVISCLLKSTAPKKSLVIAGGVANFTDVRKTFSGIIRALDEVLPQLQAQSIKVFVRRGGPHESEGLKIMKDYLSQHGLLGSVHGSDEVLTIVINEALEYIDA